MVPAVSEEVKDTLVKNIRRRMTPQPLKIRADIEMKCFQLDGVLHIKVLLKMNDMLSFSKMVVISLNFFSLGDSVVSDLFLVSFFAGSHEES